MLQDKAERLQVKPWQASLLKKCFTTKQPVICTDPRHDPGFATEVDGGPPDLRVHGTVLVPLVSHTGAAIGVLQVRDCCSCTGLLALVHEPPEAAV